ncbi:methionyl-tRNA formyltransferase [Prosthecomicrobium sp. N25]|uniref:methionyl-tRNA formyltransferase n=1 Tax=Prosthecomicrobium sp. N25 TaxID=3129254 RepID=UPI0030772F41
MRLVFVGAVEGSLVALNALIRAGLAPTLVVTLPAANAGRHSDFADLIGPARAAGSAVHETTDINAEATIAAIAAVEPDVTAVIGWSQICRAPFRAVARLGSIGFHPAPLPRFRGRAVIPWTILMGETESGSSLFWLDEGVDSGDILLQRRFPLSPDETARSLYDRHTANLAAMLPEAVARIRDGHAPREPQDHGQASWCAKRTPADGLIDWRDDAEAILRLVRAVGDPYPGAFTAHAGEKIVIDRASLFPGGRRYIGMAGQVQLFTPGGFVVRCGDGECIEVTGWRSASGKRPKMHARLGGDIA